MDDHSYGQAYADGQAELREAAARASAARREARQRKDPDDGMPGRRVSLWWRALGGAAARPRTETAI